MGWYNLVKDRGKPLVFAEYGVGVNPVGYTADNWSAQRAATMIADKTWIAAHPAFTTLLYWYNTGARGDWRFTDAASIAAWKVLQTTGTAPDGPAFARRDATVTLTGGAAADAPVQVWLHKRNNSGYVTQTVTADGSGAWSFSYTASDDYRYYTTSSEGTSPGGLTQLEPYVSGPAEAAAGSTVPLTGTARPDSTLTVWFHKQNTIGYTARRTITADGTGSWSTSYTANDDYRYYARDNNTGRASNTELTQIG
jgi:hypothetical protein